MKGIWSLAAVGILLATSAMAQDKTQFAGDGAFTAAPACDVGEITSMRDNVIKITGEAAMTYTWSQLNARTSPGGVGLFGVGDLNPAVGGAGLPPFKRRFYASEWQATTLDLNFEVKACDNLTFFLSFDLAENAPWDNEVSNGYDQDDLIEEAYFTLDGLNACGADFGLKVGKTAVPFGMGKDVLVMSPYLRGYGQGYLNTVRNGLDSWGLDLEDAHSWWYNRRFMIAPFVDINDSLKLEAAVFQDSVSDGTTNGRRNGLSPSQYFGITLPARQTNDPGASFAGRATWTPCEPLTLYASAVTRYNRDLNANYGGFFYARRSYATSLGFDLNTSFCEKDFNLFAEWQHSWRPEFIQRSHSDDIHAGLSFDVCGLTFLAQYEWLKTSYATLRPFKASTTAHRGILALQRELSSGATVEAGYQREWQKSTLFGTKATANILYASLSYKF